jgi:hypothetical protein
VRIFRVELIMPCLLSFVIGAGAAAAPRLSQAKIEPPGGHIGDHIIATVAVEDPAKQVTQVEAVVAQYPGITFYRSSASLGQIRGEPMHFRVSLPPHLVPSARGCDGSGDRPPGSESQMLFGAPPETDDEGLARAER